MKHFFDVGAYTGTTFDLFLSKHPEYDRHHIWCFEPNPKAVAKLCERIEKGELSRWNITVCPFGLGTAHCPLPFYEKTEPTGNSFYVNMHHLGAPVPNRDTDLRLMCPVVPAVTMMSIAAWEGEEVVLKLDCEGSEYNILKSILDLGYSSPVFRCISEIYVEFHQIPPNWEGKARKLKNLYAQAGKLLKPWTL